MIIYIKKLKEILPKNFKAITLGWVALIDESKRKDPDYKRHEGTHVKQFNRNPFLYHYRYCFSKRWRLRYEAEAFANEVRPYTGAARRKELYKNAKFLAGNYRLNISIERAITEIEKYL